LIDLKIKTYGIRPFSISDRNNRLGKETVIFAGCPLDDRIEGFIADEVFACRERHVDDALGNLALGFYMP
jgi:hypothetical protein